MSEITCTRSVRVLLLENSLARDNRVRRLLTNRNGTLDRGDKVVNIIKKINFFFFIAHSFRYKQKKKNIKRQREIILHARFFAGRTRLARCPPIEFVFRARPSKRSFCGLPTTDAAKFDVLTRATRPAFANTAVVFPGRNREEFQDELSETRLR